MKEAVIAIPELQFFLVRACSFADMITTQCTTSFHEFRTID
jgi:hypothetical protein